MYQMWDNMCCIIKNCPSCHFISCSNLCNTANMINIPFTMLFYLIKWNQYFILFIRNVLKIMKMFSKLTLATSIIAFNQYHCCIIDFNRGQHPFNGNICKWICRVRNIRMVCFQSVRCFHDPRVNSDLSLTPINLLWLPLDVSSQVLRKTNIYVKKS